MTTKPIYLDYNATTPVDPEVIAAMLPFFNEKFGNASSVQHAFGWDAEEAVDTAREQVANLIRTKPAGIVFTSGATEAINLGLKGYFEANRVKGNHIITCKTEHKAVLDCCTQLEKWGADVTYLNVDGSGLINPDELKESIVDQTILVAIMHANNETGVLQPIKEIAEIAHEHGAMVFSDMTQSIGKIPVAVEELGVDLAVFSSHKLYGPKGVGALHVTRQSKVDLVPQIVGGGHEKGLRSGTLNVPGIVGFGKACQLCDEKSGEEKRLGQLRDQLERDLSGLGGVKVNGKTQSQLSHVLNISFSDIEGSKLIRSLKGLAVSQGSACNSSVIEPSHVLKAMGLSDALAFSSLRISLGCFTTEQEIQLTGKIIRGAIEQLRMQLF